MSTFKAIILKLQQAPRDNQLHIGMKPSTTKEFQHSVLAATQCSGMWRTMVQRVSSSLENCENKNIYWFEIFVSRQRRHRWYRCNQCCHKWWWSLWWGLRVKHDDSGGGLLSRWNISDFFVNYWPVLYTTNRKSERCADLKSYRWIFWIRLDWRRQILYGKFELGIHECILQAGPELYLWYDKYSGNFIGNWNTLAHCASNKSAEHRVSDECSVRNATRRTILWKW